MDDISPPSGLKPKAKYFDEVGDTCINVDGAIVIMQQTNTPQAKAINLAFRRNLARLRNEAPDMAPEKMRENALFAALNDLGFNVSLTPVSGTMDDPA